jgi:hypothetical protein
VLRIPGKRFFYGKINIFAAVSVERFVLIATTLKNAKAIVSPLAVILIAFQPPKIFPGRYYQLNQVNTI